MTTQTDETMTKHGTTVEYEVVECRGCTTEKPKDDCVQFMTYDEEVRRAYSKTTVKDADRHTKGWLCSKCRDRPRVYKPPRPRWVTVFIITVVLFTVGVIIGVYLP